MLSASAMKESGYRSAQSNIFGIAEITVQRL